LSLRHWRDKGVKPENEQKGTDDEFLATAFHHENGDHGIEHCDD